VAIAEVLTARSSPRFAALCHRRAAAIRNLRLWLVFAAAPTEEAEASIFLIAWLDRHLLLVVSRRPFLLVFGLGLRLVFDLFPRHHGRRVMCGDGHCRARIRARDERHARAFFLEIAAYDHARLLIAPKPFIGRQVETAGTACEAHKNVISGVIICAPRGAKHAVARGA
jgi:hypothetical protein